MKTKIARITLTIASTLAVLGYAFVVQVALMTSGSELIHQPWFYYSAIAPFLYFGFIAGSCWLPLGDRRLRTAGIAVHLFAIPLLFRSLLGLGISLPIFALWWHFMIRERIRNVQA